MSVKWDTSLLKEAVKNAYCYADVCRSIGLEIRGRNYDTIRNWISKLELDISHFKPKSQLVAERSFVNHTVTDNEIFTNNSRSRRGTVKKRLKKIRPYECAECKLSGNWNEKPLVLHLDHINGNAVDNRLENLRFLCPNCHSQTSTYAGKSSKKKVTDPNWRKNPRPKRRKVEWPSKEELKLLLEQHTKIQIGKMYGVSDVAVGKWAKKHNLV